MNPQETWDATEEQRRRSHIENMPSIHFVCGRDWMRGPHHYEFGVMWGRDRDAPIGADVYCRRLVVRWQFAVNVDAHFSGE